MLSLFRKDTPSVGSVLFRGTHPGRPEEFSFLERSGIRITPTRDAARALWALRLEHAEWGTAELSALREAPPPPRSLIEMAVSLTEAEKGEAAAAGCIVSLRADAKRKNILRDRKNFLRFARAVMADDGLAVVDHVSQLFWSRASLDDELAHDADLDIEGVYCLHAVSRDDDREAVDWLHSHGLAELGAFDYDILSPSADLLSVRGADGLRAIAFAIVEGTLGRSEARFELAWPEGEVRTVPVEEFNRKAPPGQRALRQADAPEHNPPNGPPRSVICDPVGRVGGLIGANVRMSRFLSREIPEGTVFRCSSAATELMAERARNTLGVFRRLRDEFADLDVPCVVKLGFPVDGGGPGEREHIWFRVHGVVEPRADGTGGTFDATCLNSPHRVPSLREGQRGTHAVDLLTDWMIITPVGTITPRSTRAARVVRANRAEVAEAIRRAEQD